MRRVSIAQIIYLYICVYDPYITTFITLSPQSHGSFRASYTRGFLFTHYTEENVLCMCILANVIYLERYHLLPDFFKFTNSVNNTKACFINETVKMVCRADTTSIVFPSSLSCKIVL